VNSNLNLASKPFTNRLLPWLLTAGVLFVSFIGLLGVVHYTLQANRESEALRVEINNLRTQEKGLLDDAKKVKALMTQEQLQALEAAHQLVDRKGFSWSRLLADLEAALPGNVRVSRIAVRDIGMQGDQTVADLELTVFAKSANVVTAMIRDMDRAGIFQADLRVQNLQKGRGESGTEYDLAVIYKPRAGYPSENMAAVQETGNTGEGSK
jgi:Tfp pilus assembly protein PilN